MRIPWAAILAILVAVAGCISLPGGGIQYTSTEKGDISDMADVSLYYKPQRPVEPGETFTVKLKAENLHEKVDLENFVCNINDEGIFSLISKPYEPDMFFHNSRRFYTFELRVPPRDVIVNNIAANIGYACSYSHVAKSTLVYSVYSKQAYNDYIDQGQSLSVSSSFSSGEGPLKIKLSLGENNAVRQGSDEILEAVLSNTGSNGFVGTVDGLRNYLKPGSVEIWIEKEPLESCSIESIGGSMQCSDAEKGGRPYCKCVNTKDVRFIEGESEPLQLVLKFRDGITDHTKQFSVSAIARYSYIFQGRVDVEVKSR